MITETLILCSLIIIVMVGYIIFSKQPVWLGVFERFNQPKIFFLLSIMLILSLSFQVTESGFWLALCVGAVLLIGYFLYFTKIYQNRIFLWLFTMLFIIFVLGTTVKMLPEKNQWILYTIYFLVLISLGAWAFFGMKPDNFFTKYIPARLTSLHIYLLLGVLAICFVVQFFTFDPDDPMYYFSFILIAMFLLFLIYYALRKAPVMPGLGTA
jgi:hypothetical protein